MPECVVDQQPESLDQPLKTWGEVLSVVEGRLAPARRVVTAARFDGVDQPSFREPAFGRMPVGGIRRIDIETTAASALIAETVLAARGGIADLVAAAACVAGRLRSPRRAAANHQLAELIEGIRSLTVLTSAVGEAAALDLGRLACGGGTGARVIGAVGASLEALLDAQAAQDWPAAADCLEFELAPALDRWTTMFDAIETEVTA